MIPYTVIKEANRPEHSGTATGVINFINFSLTALLGPHLRQPADARRAAAASAGSADYQATFTPLLYGVALAIVLTLLLRETGPKARGTPSPQPAELRNRTELQTEISHVHDGPGTQAKAKAKTGSAPFKPGLWTKEINVRNFIQHNYDALSSATRASSPARPSGRWRSGKS